LEGKRLQVCVAGQEAGWAAYTSALASIDPDNETDALREFERETRSLVTKVTSFDRQLRSHHEKVNSKSSSAPAWPTNLMSAKEIMPTTCTISIKPLHYSARIMSIFHAWGHGFAEEVQSSAEGSSA
jgi:hypothetical protein